MKRITLATIGAPVGVRGQVRVNSHTAKPGDFASFAPLYLDDSSQVMHVKKLRQERDNAYIVEFEGITTREQAASLRHGNLTIARGQLPAPENEDEFYLADMIGLRVLDAEGREIGAVVGVMNYGAGDIIEVKPHDGGETALYPFSKACVPEIDLARGCLTLIVPA
ncbi:MAG: 16S rRNA processing protein RimM [Hyphomicrobiales bacterium]|nr:16S rRNA processing protein RimM [Hyphomicrobiales bacterium]